jgi:2-polyprenyl-3-methyl-5-hydroxy-6-metoxy-1,4-benzoquinol methylase
VKLINKLTEKRLYRNLSILDVGCGTGDFLVACNNKNWNVVGIEPNKNARVLVKSKLGILKSNSSNYNDKQPKIYNQIESVETDQKFDVITMWHVLEHIPNLIEYISLLKQQLKPNGTLIIAVPNYKSFDAAYYGKFWAAFDVPRHLWHFSRKAIKLLFEKEQLNVVKIIPMKLDSFYVSLLSEKYKTGKSNFIKAFLIGFKSNLKAKKSKEYSSLIYIIKNE